MKRDDAVKAVTDTMSQVAREDAAHVLAMAIATSTDDVTEALTHGIDALLLLIADHIADHGKQSEEWPGLGTLQLHLLAAKRAAQ